MKFSSLSKDGEKKEYPISADIDLKKAAAFAQLD